MKRLIPVAILAVLIIAGVALSLTVGAQGGLQALRSAAVVDPDVWEALESASEVRVFVALRQLDKPEEQTTEALRAHATEVRENVLSALDRANRTHIHRFTIAALGGYITKTGVEKLAAHPDVVDIRLVDKTPAGGDGRSQADGSKVVVDPYVWEALESASEVDVFVALRGLEKPEEQTTEALKAHAAEVQDEVLSALAPDDFRLGRRFLLSAAVSGWITREGVLTLLSHPDVVGIELSTLGERL